MQVVFGAEYRRDTLEQQGRCAQDGGHSSPAPAAPTIGIEGATKVEELFFEGRVPLAQDRRWPESLSFDTAYRYSDYGDGVQTDTYKFGLEWAPIARRPLARQLPACGSCRQHRGAVHRAGLQPVRRERRSLRCGGPRSGSERRGVHRVGRAGRARWVRRLLDSPAGQYQFLQGGNTALTPEESDTYSFGVVFTAAVRAGAGRHGRLLRHPDRQHDLDLRSSEHAGRRATRTTIAAACDRINRNPQRTAVGR